MERDPSENPLDWIRRELKQFVDTWKVSAGVDFWLEPLVACASAHDPLLPKLKEVVDPAHALPRDILPDAESVIVFFLPFKPEFGRENSDAGFHCSRNWGILYYTTNDLILAINEHLQHCLEEAGRHKACVTPATHNFDEQKLISLWSHKHLGYVAGLGTFGRNHLLITQSGCCGRLGSLVTSMPIPPTARPDREYCLDKMERECLACVSKCIYGGLKEDGYDRHACYAQCLENDSYFNDLPLVDVCGKCACDVPCSYAAP